MKGIVAVGLASIAYGIMPVFTKDLLLQGMPTVSVFFFGLHGNLFGGCLHCFRWCG
jgi:hypothetical protein